MWRTFSYRCGDFHIYSTAEVKLKFYNLLSSRNPEGTDSCSRWLRACVFGEAEQGIAVPRCLPWDALVPLSASPVRMGACAGRRALALCAHQPFCLNFALPLSGRSFWSRRALQLLQGQRAARLLRSVPAAGFVPERFHTSRAAERLPGGLEANRCLLSCQLNRNSICHRELPLK